MSDEIRVDYDELEGIANSFTSAAQNVAETGANIAACYQKVIDDKGWMGEGSESFANEMQDDVFPSYWRLYDALEDAAKCSQQIANFVKQAEEDASSLFR